MIVTSLKPGQDLYALFGNNSIGNNPTVRFMMPGYSAALATTTVRAIRVTGPKRLNRISLNATTAGSGAGTLTFTVVKVVAGNPVATTLALTIAATATTGTATGSVDLVEGDLIGIQITPTGATSSGTDYFVTLGSTDK